MESQEEKLQAMEQQIESLKLENQKMLQLSIKKIGESIVENFDKLEMN